MKTTLFFGVPLATVFALGFGMYLSAADLEWKPYTSSGGRFTAEFPGQVEVERNGSIWTVCWLTDLKTELRVGYRDYDRPPFRSADAAFREFARLAAEHENRRNVQNFMLGTRPACVFDFDSQVGTTTAWLHFRFMYVMDGTRIYHVAYAYVRDFPQQEVGEHFFRSFRITR